MPGPANDFLAKLPLVLAWIRQTLTAHAADARSVASLRFPRLPRYFGPALLDSAHVVAVERLPVPPLSQMGLAQFAEMERFIYGGITYLDTFFVTSGEERNESLHFHELIHVLQWRLLGPERFLALYAAGLAQFGYRASPLEEMAYGAQNAFDQGIAFDAEKLVAEKLKALQS
ncbi:MAG: hypothetical protein V4773_28495 [Verrucomicrobiota bacterium]